MMIETESNIILASESFMMDNPNGYFIFPLIYKGEEEGKVKISFISDDDLPIGGIKSDTDGDMLMLTCTNFNEYLGRFTKEPLHIGNIDGKKIFIHLWSSLNGKEEKIRRVGFTLFVEK